jgi:hypothetical protein
VEVKPTIDVNGFGIIGDRVFLGFSICRKPNNDHWIAGIPCMYGSTQKEY